MPFGEQFENSSIPSAEKPEETKGKEPVEQIVPTEKIKTPEKEGSTEVDDSLKLEQIREELKKIQEAEVSKKTEETDGASKKKQETGNKNNAAERKPEFREAKEKLKRNDILVGESDVGPAENLLREAGIKFEVKRFLEEEQVPNSESTLPGEFIFRLDKNDDESADKAFTILRQAKLDCHIVKDVIDLDKKNRLES